MRLTTRPAERDVWRKNSSACALASNDAEILFSANIFTAASNSLSMKSVMAGGKGPLPVPDVTGFLRHQIGNNFGNSLRNLRFPASSGNAWAPRHCPEQPEPAQLQQEA